MTTTNATAPSSPEAGLGALMDFWSGWFGQCAERTQALLSGFKDASDPAALRRLWLDSLGKSLDHYMRTPAFLESMQRNFELTTQLKGAAEDLARDASRSTGIPR